ncbi:TetR/AcrR family transcriptional regulator [Mycobacterium sp. IS-3022]|uniref:TetR/AcrR family transcriptional regulator n=1 Tax=Mycobacterium sp. IS-3022 TaxID=1772277 RepID=UPI000B046637|nr:TetR/AcrR family transcriptional regulator [Mycobacterium sp. IS-3022]
MVGAAMDRTDATDTRQRLIDAAVALFTRHSFAGTSLQMIADELGFTKAAIYHHFRTREELLGAVLEPILGELRTVVEAAEERGTPHARAEWMLSGYADVAVRNRGLVAVLAADPSVATALQQRRDWRDLITRQLRLLADVEPGPAGEIKAAMVFAGLAGAVGPMWVQFDDAALAAHLMDAGRRTLGLRTPRRSTHQRKG